MRGLHYCILIFILFAYSCKAEKTKTHSKECIEVILKKDDSLGTIRNHACEKISLSNTINQYTSSLNNLDFLNCPEDFKNAFQLHIKAWNDMTSITNNYDSLRGEMHTLFDEIESSKDSIIFKQKLKIIWDTWAVIEKRIKV